MVEQILVQVIEVIIVVTSAVHIVDLQLTAKNSRHSNNIRVFVIQIIVAAYVKTISKNVHHPHHQNFQQVKRVLLAHSAVQMYAKVFDVANLLIQCVLLVPVVVNVQHVNMVVTWLQINNVDHGQEVVNLTNMNLAPLHQNMIVIAKQKKFAIQMNIKKVLAHQQQIGFVKKRNVLVLMVLLLMDHRVIIMVRHRVILVSLDIIWKVILLE
jgi:hypothetical protein